jgi:F-type H+-transporting ATPase subunit gamma
LANLKDIRSRIQSVKNTQQITKAMKMVSAAKLRRAQDNIINCRPYAYKILNLIKDISATGQVKHDLLQKKEDPKSILYVVLTSDRGLCGGFNNNLSRWSYKKSLEMMKKYENVDFYFIGKKGSEFFKTKSISSIKVMENLAKDISYELAQSVSDDLLAKFSDGKYDEIHMVYNEFKSAIAQEVVSEMLLPLQVDLEGAADVTDLKFEPSAQEMVDPLLKKHFAVQIYRAMSESIAAEHAARMTAMENATKNAGEMIYKLTLTYNKVRQANITTELIEITSGAEALQS